jgi:hypothetical protein
MSVKENTPVLQQIEQKIFSIRGMQVMLDTDLAELYGVETKVLNQAVKRNIERFPERFRFQLSMGELRELVTNCDRLSRLKHSTSNPYVFTEQGVSMLSSVLRSETAIAVSIRIMDAFVEMRKLLSDPLSLIKRFKIIDLKLSDTDLKFEKIFEALETRNILPETGIFFEGEVFDAWVFISDLVRSAKLSILLIDNFVDDTVLTLFMKRNEGVAVTIFTRQITPQLALEADKFNKQYGGLTLRQLTTCHDRFLIVDDKVLYHIGASLKDLGKKWFGFSRIDTLAPAVMQKLNEINA